jgi:2-methylcitrate dehydratase PrpD
MEHYTDAAIARPDLLELAARITHQEIVAADGVIRFGGSVVVTLQDGRELRHTVQEADGTGARRLSAAAVEDKFRAIVAGTMTDAGCDQFLAALRRLPEGGPIDGLLAGTPGHPA